MEPPAKKKSTADYYRFFFDLQALLARFLLLSILLERFERSRTKSGEPLERLKRSSSYYRLLPHASCLGPSFIPFAFILSKPTITNTAFAFHAPPLECTTTLRSFRMRAMLDNFLQILPEVIFDAAETLGGRCTGRFYALHALENRVYDIEMEEGPHVIIKFYRPGRWSRATIQAEHDFLKALEASEIPVVCPLTDDEGQSIFEIREVMFTVFPKRPGRLGAGVGAGVKSLLLTFIQPLPTPVSQVKMRPRLPGLYRRWNDHLVRRHPH
jgi:hypothetical protein